MLVWVSTGFSMGILVAQRQANSANFLAVVGKYRPVIGLNVPGASLDS